jgi:hypothetical protein
MLHTKQIFSKYDNEIMRHQYKNFNPISLLNLNLENKKTTFKLDLQDDFILKNIQYYIAGEITLTDSTKPYSNKSYVKVVDNFVAHLFSQIEVKKHGTLVDDVENPGIASTVKCFVEYLGLNVYNGKAATFGFKSHNYEVKQFEAVGKLADLGLEFLNDIDIPIYKGDIEITFTRDSDNNVIYRWKTTKAYRTEDATSLPNKGKVEIKTFYLRVPIIEYTSETKYNLISELVKDDYFFQFKKFQCLKHTDVVGKTLYLDITTYKTMTNPVWAFVFQTNRSNNQLKNNNEFDHTNVRDLWIEVGGKRYP